MQAGEEFQEDIVGQEEEQSQEQEPAVVTPEIDWSAKEQEWAQKYNAQWEQRYNALEQKLQNVTPALQQLEAIEEQKREAVAQRIADRLSEISDNSSDPLDDSELSDLRVLVSDGLKYREQTPHIENERVAAAALNLAARHLGPEATIKDLHSLGKKLMGYKHVDLMADYLNIDKENRAARETAMRGQVAQQRISQGVDEILPSSTASGNATELRVLEAKIGDGNYTQAEFDRYRKMYANLR